MSEIPHPRTQYFMGFVQDDAAWERYTDRAAEDGVYPTRPLHLWPLMGFMIEDARWKTGQVGERRLLALCGAQLREYVSGNTGRPVPYGDHWTTSVMYELCTQCERKYFEAQCKMCRGAGYLRGRVRCPECDGTGFTPL
jgi:hypothetical protein